MSEENASIPNEEKSPMIELTGLWSHRDQKDQLFLSGPFGGATVFVFKNNYKEKENQPDYRLCVTRNRRKDDSGGSLEDVVDPLGEAPSDVPGDASALPF